LVRRDTGRCFRSRFRSHDDRRGRGGDGFRCCWSRVLGRRPVLLVARLMTGFTRLLSASLRVLLIPAGFALALLVTVATATTAPSAASLALLALALFARLLRILRRSCGVGL